MTDGRGLSNTLGFVLLFGIVFFSIAAVSTLGLGALEESRDNAVAQNAALSMETVSDAMDDIREENTTARTSVIRGGGTLSPGEETTITIRVSGAASNPVYHSENIQPIVYRTGDSEIVYEAGALIRTQDGGGGVLIDAPSFRLDGETAILPVMNTSSATGASVSSNTLTTYFEKTNTKLYSPNLPGGTVTIEIRTTEQRAGVWEQMMESRFGMTCDPTPSDMARCYENGYNTALVREIGLTYEVVN